MGKRIIIPIIYQRMSGHSKWAQIKRQKGAADVKRGQTFTKIANAITIAVRQGGGITDPQQNFRLRLVIEKARSLNMPKENIERAIQRSAGKQTGEELDEVTYEGFGPGRIAVIVEAATDNRIRTTAEIKNVFDKNGGTLATPGAVSYQFDQQGLITVKKDNVSPDDIFLAAADAGALDFEEAGSEVLLYTKPEELSKVRQLLEGKFTVVATELTRKPIVTVPVVDKEMVNKVLSFVEKLEEMDDVQKVYANFDIPDTSIEQQV